MIRSRDNQVRRAEEDKQRRLARAHLCFTAIASRLCVRSTEERIMIHQWHRKSAIRLL